MRDPASGAFYDGVGSRTGPALAAVFAREDLAEALAGQTGGRVVAVRIGDDP